MRQRTPSEQDEFVRAPSCTLVRVRMEACFLVSSFRQVVDIRLWLWTKKTSEQQINPFGVLTFRPWHVTMPCVVLVARTQSVHPWQESVYKGGAQWHTTEPVCSSAQLCCARVRLL